MKTECGITITHEKQKHNKKFIIGYISYGSWVL